MLTKEQLSAPILHTHHANELELAMKGVFCELVGVLLLEKIGQIADYGTPFMSDVAVLEKFIKLYGIGSVHSGANERLLQILLGEWTALASERGLAFLSFLLTMFYPNQFRIIRLYHSKDKAHSYPRALSEYAGENKFLTSRIRIKMAQDTDLKQVSALAPTIKRLVPAHIVPSIAVNVQIAPMQMALAGAMNGVYYFNARTPNQPLRHNASHSHNRQHRYDGQRLR